VKGLWRLGLFLALFVTLAGVGIAWAVRSTGVTAGDLGELWSLPLASLVAIFTLCAAMYVTDVLRYRAFGRAVGEHVTWRAALDACVANFFFSWITPGSALGAPAAIVMLGRRGVSWEGAALIAFGKSLTGSAVLIGIAFAFLAADLGPVLDDRARALFTWGIGVLVVVLTVPILGAIWPAGTNRWIDRSEAWLGRRGLFAGRRWQRAIAAVGNALRRTVAKLAKLREGGALMPVLLLGAHLLYFAVFVGIAVVLAMGFGASSLAHAIGVSTVYAAFTYCAPTPGGAGLSEAAAVVFFGGILPAREAVVVVLLFRSLTFYLDVVIGIVYLAVVGGSRQILERKR
jgi:uncharacterized protein (TIRG00374 family)